MLTSWPYLETKNRRHLARLFQKKLRDPARLPTVQEDPVTWPLMQSDEEGTSWRRPSEMKLGIGCTELQAWGTCKHDINVAGRLVEGYQVDHMLSGS